MSGPVRGCGAARTPDSPRVPRIAPAQAIEFTALPLGRPSCAAVPFNDPRRWRPGGAPVSESPDGDLRTDALDEELSNLQDAVEPGDPNAHLVGAAHRLRRLGGLPVHPHVSRPAGGGRRRARLEPTDRPEPGVDAHGSGARAGSRLARLAAGLASHARHATPVPGRHAPGRIRRRSRTCPPGRPSAAETCAHAHRSSAEKPREQRRSAQQLMRCPSPTDTTITSITASSAGPCAATFRSGRPPTPGTSWATIASATSAAASPSHSSERAPAAPKYCADSGVVTVESTSQLR